MRKEFNKKTKDELAKRVGYRCSNPNCRKLTIGPRSSTKNKSMSIGVAAHIIAASAKGPRGSMLSLPLDVVSIENGIWLCQSCAKFIDNDPTTYEAKMLSKWKEHSEQAALWEIERPSKSGHKENKRDIELIAFFATCLDRPAFQDQFLRERELLDNFDTAVKDTITAINTGSLYDRQNRLVAKAKGKTYLSNPCWREKMDAIVSLLRAIRDRYLVSKQEGHSRMHDTAQWMDSTRMEILTIFSSVCKEAGIKAPSVHLW